MSAVSAEMILFTVNLMKLVAIFSPKLTFNYLIRIYFVNIVIIKEDFCARISIFFYQNSLCVNTSTGF